MEHISSRANPVVRTFRAAAEAPADAVLLDGAHLLEEALRSQVAVQLVALHERLAGEASALLARRAGERGARVMLVGDRVLSAISPVRHPTGVVAVARRPAADLDTALGGPRPLVLMLAGIQDPGNVGAIVRAADACGATGIVAGEGTADAYGWKALRGSMGSAFRLPVVTGAALVQAARAARARGLHLIATIPRGGTPLPRLDLRVPAAILLGGEGAGLPPELVAAADATVSIPMSRPVESLNVAAAAAILTYEAMRQREDGTT